MFGGWIEIQFSVLKTKKLRIPPQIFLFGSWILFLFSVQTLYN